MISSGIKRLYIFGFSINLKKKLLDELINYYLIHIFNIKLQKEIICGSALTLIIFN